MTWPLVEDFFLREAAKKVIFLIVVQLSGGVGKGLAIKNFFAASLIWKLFVRNILYYILKKSNFSEKNTTIIFLPFFELNSLTLTFLKF